MTIYKTLNELQKNTNFNLDNFDLVVPKTGNRQTKTPNVSISTTSMSFNKKVADSGVLQKYMTAFLDVRGQQLMLMFSDSPLHASTALNQNKTSFTTSSKSLVEEINKNISTLNLDNFNYSFTPILLDKDAHRLVIDLAKPTSKRAKRSRR